MNSSFRSSQLYACDICEHNKRGSKYCTLNEHQTLVTYVCDDFEPSEIVMTSDFKGYQRIAEIWRNSHKIEEDTICSGEDEE